jgi:hypothetical protein
MSFLKIGKVSRYSFDRYTEIKFPEIPDSVSLKLNNYHAVMFIQSLTVLYSLHQSLSSLSVAMDL